MDLYVYVHSILICRLRSKQLRLQWQQWGGGPTQQAQKGEKAQKTQKDILRQQKW